ncbi:MAG: DegT/DnrJ/EryC1/StrS family aminotransferase [Hungatella sp.]|nr:DegT/DnrJ/EryC1/StrS family aminotransferase [Hungatella sp.]
MIPLVKPYIAPASELLPAIQKVLYSGYIAEGEKVYRFEEELGNFIGNRKILALNSGTAALHIALSILEVGSGDEVISTPMTAEPTNTTIALTGAKIVWGDVDASTGLLDPKSVYEKITERTKAIMLVHYAGMICDMDAFNKISEETGVPVIEDSAHCFGGRYNGKVIGSNSRFTCYSFQAIKQMTTVDGGAIAFQNDEDLNAARKLRWFGLDKRVPRLQNDIVKAGFKYGMNNVTAVIGSIQLGYAQEIIEKYIGNGKYYDEMLKGINGINLVPYYPHTVPSYWLYTMKVEGRKDFCRMMEDRGITASPLHHRSDTHSVFAGSRCELPQMEEWYRSFVHIPCGWWVDKEARETIVNAIKQGW